MSGISKRVSGSWVSGDYGIMKTATDTITTLPADLYPNDTTATVGLKGNMSQTGTPSPTTPIQPQECGDRTDNIANLYGIDITALSLNLKTGDNMTIVINGAKTAGANIISVAAPNITLPAGTYTVRIKMIGGTISNITGGAIFGINASTYELRTTPQVSKVGDIGIRTFTLTEDTLLTSLDITPSYGDVGSVWDNATFECWLYSGSDDIPYEPYGYKLPITSTGQTNNIYLGEVPTTRKIKKLVLDGTENWHINETVSTEDTVYLYTTVIAGNTYVPDYSVCSHFEYKDAYNIQNENGYHLLSGYGGLRFRVMRTIAATASDFKTYLQQQYAAGTPVTVWYVLAEPTTGIVNEPLRKIGDYADTASGITIPTITGKDTFDVLTTLKPSEVTVNYHGWHTGAVHERENGAWT